MRVGSLISMNRNQAMHDSLLNESKSTKIHPGILNDISDWRVSFCLLSQPPRPINNNPCPLLKSANSKVMFHITSVTNTHMFAKIISMLSLGGSYGTTNRLYSSGAFVGQDTPRRTYQDKCWLRTFEARVLALFSCNSFPKQFNR